MKAPAIIRFLAIAAALALFASCTPNGGNIYATIESAKKTVTSALAKTLTIQDLTMDTVAGFPPGAYYVAAGAIYKGGYNPGSPSTTGDVILWQTDGSGNLLPLAPPVAGQICTALVYDGAELWGAFFNPNNSTFGLYHSSGMSFASSTADPAFAGKQVMLLQMAGGTVFAVAGDVTGSPYTFGLYYYSAGWNQMQLSGASTVPYMINGVAQVGTAYWAVGGTTVHVYSSLGAVDAPVTVLDGYNLAASAGQLNGIFVDSAQNRVFIPSKSGGVYYSSNNGVGGTWSQYGPDSINGNTVGYLCVAGPVDNTSGGKEYLVGADGYGYYYMYVPPATPSFTRYNDSTILLYSTAIRRIMVDSRTIWSVFMGTAGGGLWRATFNGGVPDPSTVGWIHE
jgi:hypothetical protein